MKFVIFALALAVLAGCSSYGQQSAPGSRFATGSRAIWSSGASEFVGASAGAEATVRDAESRQAVAFAEANQLERQSAAGWNERMTLASTLEACEKILADPDSSRRQIDSCNTLRTQAHLRQVYDRNGYPPYLGYGYGYGYGYLPGYQDILAPAAIAGVYSGWSQGGQPAASASAAGIKRVEKTLTDLAGRQRAIEKDVDTLTAQKKSTEGK